MNESVLMSTSLGSPSSPPPLPSPPPPPIILQNCPKEEHDLIDFIIDHNGTEAGMVDYGMVRSLYRRGLVYFNIPISDEDFIVGERMMLDEQNPSCGVCLW